MRRPSLRLFAFAALTAGVIAAEPVRPWPPIRGELSGQLALPQIPGFPPLAWRIEAQPLSDAGLVLSATATSPGLSLRVELTPPAGDAPGTWRIGEAKIDAASWWRLTIDQAGIKSLPDDFAFTGQLTLTGAGQWRGAEASGAVHVTLAAGTAGSLTQKWTATGLGVDADLAIVANRAAVRTAQVKVATIEFAGLTARNLLLDVAAADAGRLAVTRAEVAAFGGRVTLAPFTLDPAAPAVISVADFSSVALGELAALVPQALREAQGQVAGRVAINWSLQSGIGPGDGALAVSPAEPATVRLAASPGLLTGRSPPRIELLPSFLGPVGRWFSFENPAHRMLQRIELGQSPLAVESLRVQLYPDGAGGPRSARVDVVARPTGVGDVLEKITFTVNVSGPLDQVLRLGLNDRAKIRVNGGK